jgi:hypothetical protein
VNETLSALLRLCYGAVVVALGTLRSPDPRALRRMDVLVQDSDAVEQYISSPYIISVMKNLHMRRFPVVAFKRDVMLQVLHACGCGHTERTHERGHVHSLKLLMWDTVVSYIKGITEHCIDPAVPESGTEQRMDALCAR